jgi:hypothetical protein
MLLALKDSVRGSVEVGPVGWDDASRCEEHFESALAKLTDGDLDSPYGKVLEIRFLRVYRLAKNVMGWNGTEPYLHALPETLKFRGDKVVKGDTWGTFIAFTHESANRQFDHLLPRLDLDLADESATVATEAKSVNDAREKQTAIEATTSTAKSAQGNSLLGNTIIVLGIVAALLTFLLPWMAYLTMNIATSDQE